MLQAASPASLSERRTVSVSLIGDLDADLGKILTETLGDLFRRGECDLVVGFDRVSSIQPAGLAVAARALAQFQLSGCSVVAAARKRSVRSALSAARVPLAPRSHDDAAPRRHVMIARHASN
jgi:anti-anti-sigma regulatory factor